MSDGKVIIETLLDETGIDDGIDNIKSLCKKGSEIALKSIAGVSAAITGVLGYSVKVGSSFESAMSQVGAVSGATGTDLESLTEKAQEMGAKTKFSATEAANAMNYMAMAGWKTEDMLNGIEGIMNLAAASGEDLATTSDIVTDALTAFGLTAQDSTHFADIMAAASSNANTNVSMMGETFKYVAPVAGALGYSAEDCATAIGLMANSGIKSSQAGTSLRSIMNRLASPTSEVSEAMEALGLSITNSDGSMKDLNTLMKEMRQSFSGLSEAEKAQYASSIAGTEAMSGLLAIVSASDSDFEKLTSAIYNCDGTAAQMAETMQDNLTGKLDNLESAAESFGISVYKHIEQPLKEMAEKGTDYMNQLTDALEEGGLEGAAAAAGDIIANIVTGIAQKAPDVINSAVTVIKSFIEGIKNNKDQLLEAAGSIVEALATGIADLLPESVGSAIKNVFGELKKSATDGGIKKGLETLKTLFDNLMKSLGKFINSVGPAVVKVLDFIGEHLDVIGPIVAGVITAFLTFKKVTTILETVTKVVKVFGITLNATPIGLIVSAVAGLAAALALLPSAYDTAKESASKFTDSQQEIIDKAAEAKTKCEEQKTALVDSYAEIEAKYADATSLASNLASMVDENGNIYAGYEDQASSICDQLNNLLGLNLQVQDGTITNYKEIMDSLDQIIEKKKAEALIDAGESAYAEAKQNTVQVWKDYTEAVELEKQKKEELKTAEEELAKAQEVFNSTQVQSLKYLNPGAYATYKSAVDTAQGAVDGLKDSVATASQAVKDNEDAVAQNKATIENYEAVQAAIASGSMEEMTAATERMSAGFLTAENASQGSLERQVETYQNALNSMKEAQANGMAGISDDQITYYQQLVWNAQTELAKLTDATGQSASDAANSFLTNFASTPDQAATLAANITPSMINSIISADLNGQLSSQAQQGVSSFISGLSGLDEQTRSAMANAVTPMLTELQNANPEIYNAAAENANSLLNAIITILDIHSPSRAVASLFNMAGAGATQGLTESQGEATSTASTFASSILNQLTTALSTMATRPVNTIQQMITKMKQVFTSSQLPTVARQVANTTWGNMQSALASGISRVQSATTSVCNAAKTALENAGMYDAARQVGQNFGDGLKQGIQDRSNEIATQAAQTVRNAINAANKEQNAHSPAKETIKVGHNFADGAIVGIQDRESEITKTAGGLVGKALNAVQSSALITKLRSAMDNVTGRVSNAMLLNTQGTTSGAQTGTSPVYQTININQPVKSPVETSRELRKVARELAFIK